jgi:mannose-6-phosphate isomerase
MLYPLRFRPIFKHYVWGGRRLAELLGKQLPAGQTCAESWEVVDRRPPAGEGEQSIVEFGPLAGTTLGELVDRHSVELLGRHAPQERFPLLIKFLDAAHALSVQVHPDDDRARRLTPPEPGKAEAWVVLAVEPAARIYAGLAQGVDRAALARSLARENCEDCLHWFTPRVGDCIFVPPGMVHALGAGIVVYEVQQPSDATFRLHDWNRLGPDGRPRPLHVEQALQCLDDSLGAAAARAPQPTDCPDAARLVACDKFVLDRWTLTDDRTIGGDDRAHVVTVIQGSVALEGDPTGRPLALGQTAVLPAQLGAVRIRPLVPSPAHGSPVQGPGPGNSAVLLDAYLP